MIVENIGYLNLDSVLEFEHFSIYETNKNTHILVLYTSQDKIQLDYPKQDRLPWKIIEGKKICRGVKVFDSKTDSLNNIDTSRWNGNQIMSYKQFSCF